jgi:hypothetical protein
MSVFTLCERSLGLVRGRRLVLSSSERALFDALDYAGLIEAGAQEEAVTCVRHFPGVRDGLFSTYPWVFARRVGPMTLVSKAPAVGWGNVFLPPSDCVKLHKLVSPRGTAPAYEIAGDVVYCNSGEVSAQYSVIVSDMGKWPMLFQDALCARLAFEISLAVSGEPGLSDRAFQMFQFAVSEGYRTGTIDAGLSLDNNMGTSWNTPKLFSPTPERAPGSE